MANDTMKMCSRCREMKALAEFYPEKRVADGRQAECKACARTHRLRYPRTEVDKFCKMCSITKPASDFYTASAHADGLSTYCKPCTCIHVEKTRGISGLPAIKYKYHRKYLAKYPERHKARMAVEVAIKTGVLVRPSECESCGVSGVRIEGHHWDYSRPLEVQWLCGPCHEAADVVRRNGESNQKAETA